MYTCQAETVVTHYLRNSTLHLHIIVYLFSNTLNDLDLYTERRYIKGAINIVYDKQIYIGC